MQDKCQRGDGGVGRAERCQPCSAHRPGEAGTGQDVQGSQRVGREPGAGRGVTQGLIRPPAGSLNRAVPAATGR